MYTNGVPLKVASALPAPSNSSLLPLKLKELAILEMTREPVWPIIVGQGTQIWIRRAYEMVHGKGGTGKIQERLTDLLVCLI